MDSEQLKQNTIRIGGNMKELRNESARNAYVAEFLGFVPNKIDFIDVGAMNYVYRVETSRGVIFFKQALSEAKKAGKIGADLASILPARISFEANVISAVQDELPDAISLPRILQYDKENNILVMEDVAKGGILNETALLEGNFDPIAAENIGRFLGIAHKITFGKGIVIRGSKEEDRHNWEVFLNMRTRGIKTDEDTSEELSRLFEDALKNHTQSVLIVMDCCPKNTFQRADGSIGLIDFELASGCGDPAYDLGFSLGHYFLFSVLKGVPDQALECFRKMTEAYQKEFALDGKGLERVEKYAGAVMIYRVAGSSPAPYIPVGKYEELKRKGSVIVRSGCKGLEEAVKILKKG